MNRAAISLFLLFSAAAVVAPAAHAQSLAGEINITVVDETGAIVPAAKISITKAGTDGLLRSLLSGPDGTARASLLDAGSYDLAVDASGFARLIRRDIAVAAAQVVSLELLLTPGSFSESVTVIGQTPQLQTDSSTLDQVYQQSQMLELPLNGRNYLQLGNLTAGAVPSRGSRDQTFSAYGNNGIQNAFVLDGARNENYMRGLQTRTRDLVRPPLDALQEFTVESSNFSAAYGAAAGAVVLAVTKSGSNQIHGSVYEFNQNSAINAKDLFAPPGPAPLFIRNQYGASAGAPIKKNRLWIFGAYEGTDQINHATGSTTIPTPAQIGGVFTVPVFNPFTSRANPAGAGSVRDPFPNNTVPASLFDPIGKALLGRYPAPDAAGTANNYIRQAVQNTTNRNGVARGDWRISDRDSLFVRFSAARLALNAQPPLPEPAQTPATQPADSWSIGGGYTRTFTPTVVNELRFTWTRQTSDQDGARRNRSGCLGSARSYQHSHVQYARIRGSGRRARRCGKQSVAAQRGHL
jgi:hypothetical protein